jgi:predicted metal-dependent hydrolase
MASKLYLGKLRACYTAAMTEDCAGPLHPKAVEGLQLFNERKFFQAHEALEEAWIHEKGEIRNLYKGILQVGVTYLHIMNGNYDGAIKVHHRSLKWIKDWPDLCRGIYVEKIRQDLEVVMKEVEKLGKEHINEFDLSLLKPVKWNKQNKIWICDRCGSEMHEKNCKVTCPNCGNRFDCSDLNLYFD